MSYHNRKRTRDQKYQQDISDFCLETAVLAKHCIDNGEFESWDEVETSLREHKMQPEKIEKIKELFDELQDPNKRLHSRKLEFIEFAKRKLAGPIQSQKIGRNDPYEGCHDYRIPTYSIKIWGFGKWKYTRVCTRCGNKEEIWPVTQADMVRMKLVDPHSNAIDQQKKDE